jgi:hypothetical protein
VRIVAAVVAALSHLVVGVLYISSGLVAPLWAVVFLLAVWAGFAVALGLLARRRTYWVLAVPVLALVVWATVVGFGGAWLGWTA